MELIQEEALKGVKSVKPKKNWKHELWEDFKTITITAVIAFLILHYVVQLSVVHGESMANTFHDSNIVLMEKLTQRFGELDRFDVVVFKTDNPEKPLYIKRIIGLPGDSVKIDCDGKIFVNDELIEEYYGMEVIEDPGLAFDGVTLGENQYFVLGDNRNNSIDSRFSQVGVVDKKTILGHVVYGLSPLVNPNKEQRKN